jgi:hypothetical protein
MKKITYSIACTLLFALIANVGYAQTKEQTKPKEPKLLSDQAMSDRLLKDLNTRNTMATNQPVTWYDSGNGYYYGTYAVNDQNYMVRYDAQGNYAETLTRKQWDTTTVPASVVTAFNQSPYKDYQVKSYWEVSDTDKKGYYFELDNKGTPARVWLSDQGKFSTTPVSATKPVN